jgi:hypothetical protein
LQSNTAITDLLGVYGGTSIPLISGGILPEVETDLPAIVYYNDNMLTDRSIEDTSFTINCYAETERESFLLARTILQELNGGQSFANGYPITTTCSILAVIPDPTANEVNTAVVMRLYNINGGA